LLGLQAGTAPGAATPAGQGVGGANTGNGTVTAISVGADVSPGLYTLEFTGATEFTLTDPFGSELPAGTALGAYTSTDLDFTLTAGGTAWVAGDGFTFLVGAGAYILSLPGATDGSQTPSAVLVDFAPLATTSPQNGGVYLQGEFNANAMTFGAGWTPAAAELAMRRAGRPIYLKNIGALDRTYLDPTL